MYAYDMDVAMPIEEYDRIHAEIQGRTSDVADQCLPHLVTRTDTGFRVTEVRETHEAADRWGDGDASGRRAGVRSGGGRQRSTSESGARRAQPEGRSACRGDGLTNWA